VEVGLEQAHGIWEVILTEQHDSGFVIWGSRSIWRVTASLSCILVMDVAVVRFALLNRQ
jgi:hypothetical protein